MAARKKMDVPEGGGEAPKAYTPRAFVLDENTKQIISLLVNFALERAFEYLERKQVFSLRAPQSSADVPPGAQVAPIEPPPQ